ncbi:hypothetical protein Naga_100228g8 [Nannochloropsis gaditana]|uniref:Uncharacterized protein n=1 Tax=Nannochloropsis gaditana TaxID=72520 RepID=W7T1M8_9STRA|nr:hypothetical protein Naga_100228g8 [Nannochloropsis gaditana]
MSPLRTQLLDVHCFPAQCPPCQSLLHLPGRREERMKAVRPPPPPPPLPPPPPPRLLLHLPHLPEVQEEAHLRHQLLHVEAKENEEKKVTNEKKGIGGEGARPPPNGSSGSTRTGGGKRGSEKGGEGKKGEETDATIQSHPPAHHEDVGGEAEVGKEREGGREEGREEGREDAREEGTGTTGTPGSGPGRRRGNAGRREGREEWRVGMTGGKRTGGAR